MRGSSDQAFTLVELMVAMTVLSLMIVFLFSVFNQAAQAWQASEKKVDAFREARAALYVMRRDIGGLVLQTNIPMAFNGAGTTFPAAAQLASTNSLFLVSSQSSASQGGISGGDLCTVGYYVAWSTNEFKTSAAGTNDPGVGKSYNLFRYFRDNNDTFTNMSNYKQQLAGSTNLASRLNFLFPDVSSAPFSGDEVLARNVVAFSVVPYYRQGVLPAQATNGVLTNRVTYLDVNLTVVNYATAALLGNAAGDGANWNTNGAMKNLIEKNKQDFHNRIPLNR